MFVTTDGARLFATRQGPRSGSTILAIGGWIGSSELWTEPLSMLSDRHASIAYDHRGSGVSICATESITFKALVADAVAVLDAYGVSRCVLAAESAGALTALAVAARHPERVSHLVIVDGMFHRGVAGDQDLFLRGLETAYPATIERFVQLCIPEPDCEHIKSWGRQILARARPEAAIALRVLGSDVDIRPILPTIRQPTLVLHGELDAIVPIAQGRALAQTLPHAEFQALAGAGHVPTLTRPAEVAQAMAEFLARHGA